VHQLVIRGFSIVDARCNHEVNFDPYDGHSDIVKFRLTAKLQTANVATKIQQSSSYGIPETELNSVALVRKRTIPTERPPPVGGVVPTFAGRGVSRGQRNESPRPLISVF